MSSNKRPDRVVFQLENQLTVILEPNHFAPVVATQVWVNVGSADEQKEEAGLAHFLEHMLFKGTQKRQVGEIAKEVENLGGNINAWTSFDQTVYHTVLPSKNYKPGLDILADMVFESVFDAKEIASESGVILEELKRGEDVPWSQLMKQMFRTVFLKHPYRRPVIGKKETIAGFQRHDLVQFFEKWYQPNNMTLVVVGDLDVEEARKEITQAFGRKENAYPLVEKKRTQEEPQTSLRTGWLTEEIHESYLQIGFQIPGMRDVDIYALKLLAAILGQGDSSRLEAELQRKKQVLNGFSTSVYAPRELGVFFLGAHFATGKEKEALQGLLRELTRLQVHLPSAKELMKAKNIAKSSPIYQRETMQGIAQSIGSYHVVAGDLAFEQEFYTGLESVTVEQIRTVAQKYLVLENASVVSMTPTAFSDESPFSDTWLQETFQKELQEHAVEAPIQEGFQEFRLENGIRVLCKEAHHNEMFAIRAVMLGGSRYETEDNNGLNHLTSRMLTQGTSHKNSSQLAEELDLLASSIGGFAGRNSIGLNGVFLSEHGNQGLELFFDCLLHPLFDESELEREKWMVLEDIQSKNDSPSEKTFELFYETLFQKHPYRLPLEGKKESVERLDSDSLRRYYFQQLQPENLVISIVGDINTHEILAMVEEKCSHLEAKGFQPLVLEKEPPLLEKQIAVRYQEKQQAHVVYGFQGMDMKNADKRVFDVINGILSGQGGRLFLSLRDEQSLAYSVSSFSAELIEPGYFGVYIGTSPEKMEQAERGFEEQLQKLKDELVGEEELQQVKNSLVGSHSISMQRSGGQATAYALNELYGLPLEDILDYPNKIEKITAKDVQRVAQTYFRFEHSVLVRTQPSAKEEITEVT